MILVVTPDIGRAAGLSLSDVAPTGSHHIDDPQPDIASIIGFVKENDVDLVFVGPGIDETAPEIVRELNRKTPGVGVIMMIESEDATAVRSGFRAGADDVVAVDIDPDELGEIADQVRARAAGRTNQPAVAVEDHGHRTISVVSSRGGVGRTVVAAGLATALERRHSGEVVLVDLDLQSGDVAASFALPGDQSIAALVGRAGELDSAAVKALLRQTGDGLHTLVAPTSLAAATKVSPDLVKRLLAVLAKSFRFVVIDTSAEITEVSLAAIDASSDLVLVVAPDAPSVRAIGRVFDAFDELNVVDPERHLVVNRATERYGMSTRDIENVTGMAPIAQVPATKEIVMAVNSGRPLGEVTQPRSVLQKGLRPLVDELAPQPVASRGASLFGRRR